MYDPEQAEESGAPRADGLGRASPFSPAKKSAAQGAASGVPVNPGTPNGAFGPRTPSANAAATQLMSMWASDAGGRSHPAIATASPGSVHGAGPGRGIQLASSAEIGLTRGHDHDLSQVSELAGWSLQRTPSVGRFEESPGTIFNPSAQISHGAQKSGGAGAEGTGGKTQAPGSSAGGDALRRYIERNEGRKKHVYIDTKGHPTVGIGFNLDRGDARAVMQSEDIDYAAVREGRAALTDEQVDRLFARDVATAERDARAVVGGGTFDALTEGRRIVLIDMVFNLGKAGLAAFRKAILALQQGNYEETALQMIDSSWYHQVGSRAQRNVEMMRAGGGPGGAPAAASPNHAPGGPASQSGQQGAGGRAGAGHAPNTWKPAADLSDVRAGRAVLRMGEEGPAVAQIQKLLHVTADGRFGAGSERAVKTFQGQHSLTVDGVVGKATLRALESPGGGFLATGAGRVSAGTPAHASEPSAAPGRAAGAHGHAADVPGFAEIAKDFGAGIPGGGSLTWHDALYLPSWKRHVQIDEVSTTILANVTRQAQALAKLSQHFGKSISVHCWLRPKKYNAHIGGASNSAHLRGSATDFHMPGLTAEQVRKEIIAKPDLYPGAGELGVSWVHLDLEHATWFGK